MASVATCPYCYLRLAVPVGVEADERVECPTCAKEFSLDQVTLSPMPEVVRRSQAAQTLTSAPAANEVVEAIEEVVIEERLAKASPPNVEPEADDDAARLLEGIKAKIESELAAGSLTPGSNQVLSLDAPALSMELDQPTEDDPTADKFEDPLSAFRNAKTVAEFPEFGDELERREKINLDVSVADITARIDEPVASVEETGDAADEPAVESTDSRLPQPTVRTLADWMQPRQEVPESEPLSEPLAAEIEAEEEFEAEDEVEAEAEYEEVAEVAEDPRVPSFDLPNVPLTPNIGATVEFDPSMSFGPSAETEFELDNVNFETPDDEPLADKVVEESKPVFPEKEEPSAAPFVLPGVPRTRKNRSIVRVLVGTALGGVVGVLAAAYILLWLLGPDGDLLHVAKYIPSAALPKSFQTPTPIAKVEQPAAPPEESASAPVAIASDETTAEAEESSSIPAGYVEETSANSETVAADEAPADDRYSTEPAPLDEPAAEPIAEEASAATAQALPLHGPTFTVDQLATALEAGKAAQSGLVDGDLSDGAVRRTKGASYEKFAALAESLTFVDRSSPSIESEHATNGANQLFAEVFANPHTRNEIARIVSIWIASSHRSNSGIFFAGSLSGGEIAGDVYEYEATTEEGGKFTLLAAEPIDSVVEGIGGQIGIVGAIVDDPAQNVTGYSGTAKRAVWLTRAIPLK